MLVETAKNYSAMSSIGASLIYEDAMRAIREVRLRNTWRRFSSAGPGEPPSLWGYDIRAL